MRLAEAQPQKVHLQDWTVVLNGERRVRASGQRLAQYSKYFHDRLLAQDARDGPASVIASSERQISVSYEDVDSLEFLLKFINDFAWRPEGGWCVGPRELPGLVLAADHFQVPKLLDFLLHSTLQQAGQDGNWWQYWRAAACSKVLTTLVQAQVARDFLEAAADDAFLQLTEEELVGLLRHQQLNVSSELQLVPHIERWIEHRAAERCSCTWRLLCCLRLGQLTRQQIRALANSRWARASGCEQQLLSLDFTAAAQPNASYTSSMAYLRTARSPHEVIFLCGGWEGLQNDPNFGPSDAVQVYNYQDCTWTRYSSARLLPAPALNCGHAYSGCVLLQFEIYVIGGYVQGRGDHTFQGPTASVKAYDLRSRRWRERAAMHQPRNYVSCAVLGNRVYAVGGHNGRLRLNSAERYCPEDNRWSLIASLHHVRSDAGCAALGDSVYVCGGFNGHQFFNSVERYDPAGDQWTLVSAMASIRSGVSLCACGGALYALGGNNGASRLATVERYDPEVDEWAPMPPMLTQRSNFSACVLRGEVYAVGGWSDQTNSTVSVVEKWTPGVASRWEAATELHMPASANCCCAVPGLHRTEGLVSSATLQDSLEAVD